MTEFECAKYALMVTKTDIFCAGAIIGGAAVVVARFLENFLEQKFMADAKKRNLLLGEAVKQMQIDLDDRILKLHGAKK